MDCVYIRKWLEGNKVWFETITVLFLSLAAIIVSINQCSIAKRQYQASIDPAISVEIDGAGLLENGVYKLKIINNSADVCNVKVYENYLTCPIERLGGRGAINTNKFGISAISRQPKKIFPLLEKGAIIQYAIDKMKDAANATEGQSIPCFLKLRIEYERKVDGKKYQKLKAYGLTNALFDLEGEGGGLLVAGFPHIERVRDLLLNKF